MHIRKTVYLALFFLVSGVCAAQGFELKKFAWGEAQETVIARLKEEGRALKPAVAKEIVSYDDFFLGSKCEVMCIFTPKSLKLAMVQIQWEDTGLGDEVLKNVTERYGDPVRVSPSLKHYEWKGSFEGETITLDYAQTGKLAIYGGEYYQRYLSERKN